MRRWPNLRERKPQHLSAARAACANQTTVDSWFVKVREFSKSAELIDGSGGMVEGYEGRLMKVVFVLVLQARSWLHGDKLKMYKIGTTSPKRSFLT